MIDNHEHVYAVNGEPNEELAKTHKHIYIVNPFGETPGGETSTSALNVSSPVNESLSGTATKQNIVNQENKMAIQTLQGLMPLNVIGTKVDETPILAPGVFTFPLPIGTKAKAKLEIFLRFLNNTESSQNRPIIIRLKNTATGLYQQGNRIYEYNYIRSDQTRGDLQGNNTVSTEFEITTYGSNITADIIAVKNDNRAEFKFEWHNTNNSQGDPLTVALDGRSDTESKAIYGFNLGGNFNTDQYELEIEVLAPNVANTETNFTYEPNTLGEIGSILVQSNDLVELTAEQIPMSETDNTTVAEAILNSAREPQRVYENNATVEIPSNSYVTLLSIPKSEFTVGKAYNIDSEVRGTISTQGTYVFRVVYKSVDNLTTVLIPEQQKNYSNVSDVFLTPPNVIRPWILNDGTGGTVEFQMRKNTSSGTGATILNTSVNIYCK